MALEKSKESEDDRFKDDNLDNTDSALPTPPDGGWGWVVVFGSFMVHIVADGVAYSFGVFLNAFIDHFGGGRGETGWLGSLMIGVTWGSGPIASALTNKFGCKLVTIAGALLSSFGFIVSIFAPNIWFMYFSFGIVSGLGLGLIYLPAIVSVTFYFEKRRSFATGLAVCGSGVGTFIFAPLTRFLLDEYGWKGAVLIEAGLMLNCIVFGLLFRPVEAPRKCKVPMEQEMMSLNADTNTEGSLSMLADKGASHQIATPGDTAATHRKSDGQVELHPMDRKDVFYSGSLGNIPLYKSNPALYTQSITSLHNIDDTDDADTKRKCCNCGEMTATFVEMTDLSLFKDIIFVLYGISNMLTCFAFCVPYIFLPDRAMHLGFSESESAFLISIIGISNTVGRIVFGFVADLKVVNRLMLYNTILSICGICTAISIFAVDYPLLATYAASFGMCMGVYVSLTSVITVDLLGLDKLTNAFGLILFFQGIGAVIGPPVAGWIYDATGNYHASFAFMGAVIALSGAMLYIIPCIKRCQHGDPNQDAHDSAMGKKVTSVEHIPVPTENC